MKITKAQIKQIIKEEMQQDHGLRKAIDNLADKIDNLDVSLDYLAAAVTGEDALALGLGQQALGRMARPHKRPTKDSIEEMVREELEEVLGPDADEGDYVEDFKDSDAPQFRGKSQKKRREMAIAAHADAKDGRGKK